MRSAAAASVLVALLAAAPAALAQCTIPAIEPPLTAGDCAAELEAGESCTVACAAGQAQGAEGSYVYTCNADGDGFDAEPAPACSACPADSYSDAAGSAECLDCPADSSTEGEGSAAISDCLCNAGYAGEIEGPGDECTACLLGTYKEAQGPADCLPCPAESSTAEAGSTAVTDCLCNAGYSGEITEPSSVCTGCDIGTYKEAPGPTDCLPCPTRSTTPATASETVTDCRCEQGYYREEEIAGPDDDCAPCAVDFFKPVEGSFPCTACEEGTSTGGNEAALECTPEGTGGLSTGAVVGITAAALVGVGAAFGGVMYGKSNYNRYRRESVNQNAPNEPLMAGGQS